MTTVTITPTGGSDDYSKIQNAINGLNSGDTIILNGDFVTRNTIKLKSNIIWILNGSIKLGDNVNKDMIINNGILTNISMSGGIYDGNLSKQNAEYRIVDFTQLTKSHFSDMICQNGGKGFTIAKGCSGNTFDRIIGKNCGNQTSTTGNGLGDRGDHNIWNDCIAENNWSDNFIIKCRDSTFNRCIARNGISKVGFGFYARVDGVSTDTGETISRNKFNDCQAYGNAHAGFSLNIGTNCPNGKIENNIIQAVLYDNCKVQDSPQAGIYFRNKLSSGSIRGNNIDVLVYNNKSKGGLAFEATFPITGNTGSMVAYGNIANDIDISGSGNNFTAFHPIDKPAPKIVKGSNTVTVTNFDCNNVPAKFCTQEYCGTSSILTSITIAPANASININGTIQLTATCKDQNNNTMTCPALTWSSTDSTKATVNSSGLVTGVSTGTANITAKSGTITSNVSTITITVVVKKFRVDNVVPNTVVNNVGVLVILDNNGAFTKDQACIEACTRLGQI